MNLLARLDRRMGDPARAPPRRSSGDIVEIIAARDEQAATFVGLVEQRLDPAWRLARAILLDDDEADDAVQDACLVAWRERRSLRDHARFGAWFDRILINRCRDRLRVRRRQRVRAIALLEQAHVGQEIDATSADVALDGAFDDLDDDHRIVVLLRFWQDLQLDEIADRLDIPLGTVKSRLHYALRAIRSRLEATDGRP
jgi:RNA polymerase sigma-70 factor (ECF subfamily)